MQVLHPYSRQAESETLGWKQQSVYYQAVQVILMHVKVRESLQ